MQKLQQMPTVRRCSVDVWAVSHAFEQVLQRDKLGAVTPGRSLCLQVFTMLLDMLTTAAKASSLFQLLDAGTARVGAWLPQGDGCVDASGRLQGPEEVEEDQEGPQAPLLG